MGGSLNKPEGSDIKRKIALVNVTGKTPSQIETHYNSSYGVVGWRIHQVIVIGSSTFLLAEKEY